MDVANVKLRVDAPVNEAPRRPARPQERSLVRIAVALLLQNPGFATQIEPPHTFSALRLPGIALLVELIALCRERPEIKTAAIVDLYAEREEGRALQKLAVMEFPGGENAWQAEFFDALKQLDRQTRIQRRDELDARVRSGGITSLSTEEKDELRTLKVAVSATPAR